MVFQIEALRRRNGVYWEQFSLVHLGRWGYEMKLEVGPVQSHLKDFVLYSKGSRKVLMFLKREMRERNKVEWEAVI